jgi:elongation factor 2
MSVIAHVDHGKTTLTDSLIGHNGIIAADKVGSACFMMNSEEEQLRGITIKSTGVSLYYELDYKNMPVGDLAQEATTEGGAATLAASTAEENQYLINLIDSPGHVDFSSEVTAALRVTDGALVVVDYIEGVCVQTETVLRQALTEKIKPVLMINKVDRGILELQVSGEEMYQRFLRVIESVNVVVSTYESSDMPESQQLDPVQGNVAFGAAIFGWAFTLNKMARTYAKKFNLKETALVKKLWGDNFYDPSTKKWTTSSTGADGSTLPRGFVQFIMDPIIRMKKACMEGNIEAVTRMTERLAIKLSKDEQ